SFVIPCSPRSGDSTSCTILLLRLEMAWGSSPSLANTLELREKKASTSRQLSILTVFIVLLIFQVKKFERYISNHWQLFSVIRTNIKMRKLQAPRILTIKDIGP